MEGGHYGGEGVVGPPLENLAEIRRKRWIGHKAHEGIPPPARVSWSQPKRGSQPGDASLVPTSRNPPNKSVVLDGSQGEGGGQILRTALSLSLLTGRPFQITRIRANRDKPGLRPQHLRAVEAAALLCDAELSGAEVGSRELRFRPHGYEPRDLTIDIGTAGSTGLVLQTLHLPLALRASSAVRIVLTGGTFNPKAPPYPFLEQTWRAYLSVFGMPIALSMTAAGFYPRGGGRLEAWIEPAAPQPWIQTDRGPLRKIRGLAGVSNLRDDIATRLRDRALKRLEAEDLGVGAEIELGRWPSPGQGASISLFAEYERGVPSTFVGLGERGNPAEHVADEAVDKFLNFHAVKDGAVDPHSADQILVPLALAEGRSIYTVSEVSEHLRTNALTIGSFLDRSIVIEGSDHEGEPGRVVIG